jgi:type II secretory pathway pseudopilin PulG
MKIPPVKKSGQSGSSLIEVVIAVGVMAVAVPLVFGALAESGKSGMSAEAETRSAWMVPICMEEIRASREGRSEYFTTTTTGQVFPPASEVWALAFSPEGKPLGKVSKSEYDKGIKTLGTSKVLYLTTLSSTVPKTQTGPVPMLSARISLEYPSGAPAAKRQKLDFFTRIP